MAVSREIAQQDVSGWLDYKKKSQQKRDNISETISGLVDAVVDGDIIINEDFSIVQVLRFPIEDKDGKPVLSKLEYKPRLKAETLQMHCQGLRAGDADGRVNAHIAALTSNSKDIVKKMDVDDYTLASLIVTVFFS